MEKEEAKKRIKKAVDYKLVAQPEALKDYFCEAIYSHFIILESENREHDVLTSVDNLDYAISINLYEEFYAILDDAVSEGVI